MSGTIKSEAEIQAMREGGQMLGRVLQVTKAALRPCITTDELNDVAVAELKRLGGEPAFLGHEGFPKVICISVNDEVVHGIPGKRVIA